MKNFFEHIDDYLNNNLSEEDRAAFETEMAINEELEMAVKNHPAAMSVIGSLIEEETRSSIADILSESIPSPATSKGNIRQTTRLRQIMSWVAAACTIGAVAMWGWSGYQYGQLEDNILANHVQDISLRDTKGGQAVTTMDSIIHFYNTNQRDAAISRIDQLLLTDLTDGDRLQYQRIKMYSLFYSKEYSAAADQAKVLTGMVPEDSELLYFSLVLAKRKGEARRVLDMMDDGTQNRIRHLLE